MIKVILIPIIFILISSIIGCVDNDIPEIISLNQSTISQNLTYNNSEVYKTTISYPDKSTTVIIGKIIEIRFICDGTDILIFEDGFIYNFWDAELCTWKLGAIHRITNGNRVEILNDCGEVEYTSTAGFEAAGFEAIICLLAIFFVFYIYKRKLKT